MRILRLNLLRYGRFTDSVLEFPAHKPDIHIVFGPNEAGKSTAMSALEDFLFGILPNSPLGFLHGYGNMRIGAVLQKDGKTLEARRRKGNKDTLLTREEAPIPAGDGELAMFLAGADRTFFSRMFSLDHARLRQGGREILEARDEVGQILFSASAGIAGLRHQLTALEKEADTLWASRRATHRKYYQAKDRLKTAEDALREHTVTANRWQELRRAYDSACEEYDALDKEIKGKSAELRKLSRIRRVYRDVRRKSELDASIGELGTIPAFPEGARQNLLKAEGDDAQASARIKILTEQLEAARKERTALTYDEELLFRAEYIQQLHEQCIQLRAGKRDLPKRRAELSIAEVDLRRLASELEWETADIDHLVGQIPARSKVVRVRSLLNRRGEQLSAVETAQVMLEEAEARHAEITLQLTQMGVQVDVFVLTAVIKATRESGDITSRIQSEKSETQDVRATIQRHLQSLKPEVSAEKALASMSIPPRETVQIHRDTFRDLEQNLHACRKRIRAEEQELILRKNAHARVARDEHAVPFEELSRLRLRRDTGWSLIRRHYVESTSIPEEDMRAFIGNEGDLLESYEAAVGQADTTADLRFDKAEATARLAVISRQIAEQEDLLGSILREEESLAEEYQVLNAAWLKMWTNAPFSPLSPDSMLDWINTRTELLGLVDRCDAAERQAAILRREESEMKDRIVRELEHLHVEVENLKAQPLSVLLEAATDVQRRYEQHAENRQKLEEGLQKATADAEIKHKLNEKSRRAWSEWESQWTDAVSMLTLGKVANPEAVSAQVDAIDEMREIAVKVNELRHERIGKIERDLAAFSSDVAEIVSTIASDLAEAEPDDVALELRRRLDKANQIREIQKEKDKTVASLKEKIEECEESRSGAREIIRHLQDTGDVENIDDLREAIDRSDSLRAMKTELSLVTEALMVEGDGQSIADLLDECNAVDLDQIAAREEAFTHELQELRERQMETRERRTEARQRFEAIGGDDASAKAAADRQAALAEMEEISEQYVRVRSANFLLQWAIDRYRREKQAPLLKRAGPLFTTLTNGSFNDLRLEFDELDHVHLIGLRPDGTRVGVDGMSTGTADQLYLALRLASIEDYLERANPLPFVADDLFINFDDKRAASGFEVLGQLAQKTQVLFFTHHRHLVDVARKTLDPSVSIVSLLQGDAIM